MFKDPKTKNIALIAVAVVIISWVIWYLFIKKNKNQLVINFPESSFGEDLSDLNSEVDEAVEDMPGLMNLEYMISTKGKKAVFPMIIEKVTPGPIELPNRRSLLNKDAKYKFVDVMPGDRIKILSMQRLSYTVDHQAFTDVFLVTSNDFLIAVTQAKEHFKLIKE